MITMFGDRGNRRRVWKQRHSSLASQFPHGHFQLKRTKEQQPFTPKILSLRLRLRTCSAPSSVLPFNRLRHGNVRFGVACMPSSPNPSPVPKTRLFVSGLSFRTTEESLRNAFEKFGQLVEVNLVMDKIANRPRGFAFLHYSTEEESEKAIKGVHGKFLDGRVRFVEVAKPRAALSAKTRA